MSFRISQFEKATPVRDLDMISAHQLQHIPDHGSNRVEYQNTMLRLPPCNEMCCGQVRAERSDGIYTSTAASLVHNVADLLRQLPYAKVGDLGVLSDASMALCDNLITSAVYTCTIRSCTSPR